MSGVELSDRQSLSADQLVGANPRLQTSIYGILERPILAPNVQLVGEMPGTGFTDRQWLIQRDGRFIQLTELLYRIAEQANGERTLTEIAEEVTQSTDWVVEADDVRHLLQRKLVPLGLIATEDGSILSDRGAPHENLGHSPLALTLRVKTLSPRFIDPITKVLQAFYAPPLLGAVLILAGVYHWWLYREHGIIESIKDILYMPGGLLLALAIVILAGMFHEFGHAAALRYGGGKVRGMGIGLYLFYPVLYTDVTDSYRLDRWDRVRTDLGGIYFHLIFALGLIALSIATGTEFLLFVVVLINLEMLHQLLPLVRLDGYWLLADLTGIPDFFSQMGPFLRSVFLGAKVKEDKLPNLKPWVKVAFAVYLTVTVPLLAYAFYSMVQDLPRLLYWTADAFLKQVQIFSISWGQGDVLTMLLSGIQLLLLALPIVGTLYILTSVGHTAMRSLWNWSKPTGTRRAIGVLSATAAVCWIILLWAPQLGGSAANQAAQTSSNLASSHLGQARKATTELKTLRADLEGALDSEHFTGTVLLKRPNLAHVEIKGGADLREFRVVSDGQQHLVYFPANNQYTQSPPGPEGHNIQAFVAEQVDHFFRPETIGAIPVEGLSRYIGKEMIDGSTYEVVETETPSPRETTTRYFISPTDHLVHRVVTTTERKDGQTATAWSMLKNVQPDVAIEETAFQWTPPPTASPLQLPTGLQLPAGEGNSRQ